MSPSPHARFELAGFLKTRRRHISPETVGLPTSGRRRTSGLKREEVSLLSGVSLTWYTWLEQARDIRPSRQVIDALARTLQMSVVEHEYVLRLTGHSIEPVAEHASLMLPAHAQRLLDALGDCPAYAITQNWSILGWNRCYEALYPNVATNAGPERNLLWLVFTDPYVHELLADWRSDSMRFLNQFRAEAGSRIHEPHFAELVARLQEVSEHFRRGWASFDVEQFTSLQRRFRHPRVGSLLLEHHRLSLSDCPDLHLVVYTPVHATGTAERLADLNAGSLPGSTRLAASGV